MNEDDELEHWIAPDTDGLPCDTLISNLGDAYMRRFYITTSTNRTTARYHHILASDPDRDFHDHPWDFVSTLLKGIYIEHTPKGSVVYKAPCVITRKASQLHRLELPEGPVWSYVLLGPVIRKWGYLTKRGWVPWDRYNGGSIAGCGPENPHRPMTVKRKHRRLAKWLNIPEQDPDHHGATWLTKAAPGIGALFKVQQCRQRCDRAR